MEFEEARERVRNLGLGSLQEWQEWCIEGRTFNVPTNPHVAYAFDGWLSWADWLGFGEGQVRDTRVVFVYPPLYCMPMRRWL